MEHHVAQYGEYMPHGMCLLWKPWLVLLWAGSDLLIFLSYTAIPLAILLVLRKRTEVPQFGLITLFASFILLCGITHFFMIVTLWVPIYPFVAWIKLATGLVSMATAIVLFRLVPDIIGLPSPSALERANVELQGEIAAHQRTLASLDALVRERTAELEKATTALAVQTRETLHRSSNLLSVVQALASQTALGSADLEDFLPAFTGRIKALAVAMRSVTGPDSASLDLRELVEAGLAFCTETYGKRLSIDGPDLPLSSEAAQQISLALHELATNTHKYGLGRSPEARVDLSWAVSDTEFNLTWREEGGQTFDPGQRQGFGTMLLTTIVPATLEGTAQLGIEGPALVYRLTAPLAAILPSDTLPEDSGLAASIIEERFGR